MLFKGSDKSRKGPKCVNYGPLMHELWALGTGGIILEGAVGLKQTFGNLGHDLNQLIPSDENKAVWGTFLII